MADTDTLYLENLDEFVNDENRIVTCKWLSNSLKITGNKSKEFLKHFADEELKKKHNLTVTYLIGGKVQLQEGKLGYRYVIVKEENVEAMKQTFEKVTCCHVYSVQKSTLKNPEMLCNVEVDMMKTSLHELFNWSGIYCSEANRNQMSATSRGDAPSSKASGSNGLQAAKKPSTDIRKQTENKELSTERPQSLLPSTKSSTTATSFFGASNSKAKEKKATSSDKTQGTEKSKISTEQIKDQPTKHSKKEKKELSFFGKSIQGNSTSKFKAVEGNAVRPSEHAQKNTESRKASAADKMEVDIDVEEDIDIDVEQADDSQKERKKKTKREDESSAELNTNDAKRRKTVIQESESEEDDFESFIKNSKPKDEVERAVDNKRESTGQVTGDAVSKSKKSSEVKEKSEKRRKTGAQGTEESAKKEEPVTAVIAEESKRTDDKPKEKRRIRRKVMRSKTFMNDEGYMVTEKVYESESATDDSDTESTKPKKTDLAHRKPKDITAENKKTKLEASKHKNQASLMSFFKKK